MREEESGKIHSAMLSQPPKNPPRLRHPSLEGIFQGLELFFYNRKSPIGNAPSLVAKILPSMNGFKPDSPKKRGWKRSSTFYENLLFSRVWGFSKVWNSSSTIGNRKSPIGNAPHLLWLKFFRA